MSSITPQVKKQYGLLLSCAASELLGRLYDTCFPSGDLSHCELMKPSAAAECSFQHSLVLLSA